MNTKSFIQMRRIRIGCESHEENCTCMHFPCCISHFILCLPGIHQITPHNNC